MEQTWDSPKYHKQASSIVEAVKDKRDQWWRRRKINQWTLRCRCFSRIRSPVGVRSVDSLEGSCCRPSELNDGARNLSSVASRSPSLKFFVKNARDGIGNGVCLRRVSILNIVACVWSLICNWRVEMKRKNTKTKILLSDLFRCKLGKTERWRYFCASIRSVQMKEENLAKVCWQQSNVRKSLVQERYREWWVLF